MSVGNNNHYCISEVTPRHFQQTADRYKYDAAERRLITTILDDQRLFGWAAGVPLFSGRQRQAVRLPGLDPAAVPIGRPAKCAGA